MKSIDNFTYVISARDHAAVPGRGHVLPDRRPARVGAGRSRSSTRSTTASSSSAHAVLRLRAAGSTSCHLAVLVAFGLLMWRLAIWRLEQRLGGLGRPRANVNGVMPQVLDIEQAVLLLEIEPPFDKRDIQLARRRLAKRWHPTSRRPASSSSTSAT